LYGDKRYHSIEARLKNELDKARDEYETASRDFNLIINEIPSGIPQPDGDLRIRQAGSASRSAMRKYALALKRFSQFTLPGVEPEDLKGID
jgi:hypothetical protein